jgi:hypothetical protein
MFSKNQWIVPDKYKNGTRFVFPHRHAINVGAGLPAMASTPQHPHRRQANCHMSQPIPVSAYTG